MAQRISQSRSGDIELRVRSPDLKAVFNTDDVESLQTWLNKSGNTIDNQDELQAYILHRACRSNCPRCVCLLLQQTGISLTLKLYDVNHFSPMHIAAHANQISVISVLLSHEPNLLNFPSGRGETPVMIACLAGHKQAVECLQQCRADLSLTSADESTVLHYAASSNASDVMEYILYVTDQDCINRKNNRGDTPTHSAVRTGNAECVRVLCKHGANLSIKNNANMTALQLASSLGNQQCLRHLTAGVATTNTTAEAAVKCVSDKRGVVMSGHGPSETHVEILNEVTKSQKLALLDSPPASLSNDKKTRFHEEEIIVETHRSGGDKKPSQGSGKKENGAQSVRHTHSVAATPSSSTQRRRTRHDSESGQYDLYHEEADDAETMKKTSSLPRVDTVDTDKQPPHRQQRRKAYTDPSRKKRRVTRERVSHLANTVHSPAQISSEQEAAKDMRKEPSRCQQTVSFTTTPPPSLENDQKQQFHEEEYRVETHQHEDQESEGHSEQDENSHSSVAQPYSDQSDESECSFDSKEEEMVKSQEMPPTQAMKKKTGSLPRTVPVGGADASTQQAQGKQRKNESNKKNKKKQCGKKTNKESEYCETCGSKMIKSTTTCKGAKGIYSPFEFIEMTPNGEIKKSKLLCPICHAVVWPHMSSPPKFNDLHTVETQVQQAPYPGSKQKEDSGVYDMSGSLTRSMVTTLASASPNIASQRAKIDSPIAILKHPVDTTVRYGEEAVVDCSAHSSDGELIYQWYTKNKAKRNKIKRAKSRELHYLMTTTDYITVICRVSLANDKDKHLYSDEVRITPKLVWFSEDLQCVGGYLSETTVLTCRAECADSLREPISYLWMKRNSKYSSPNPCSGTDRGVLTFNPLTHQDEGFYTCQANVSGYKANSQEVYVRGKIRKHEATGQLKIVKQPRSYAVKEGGSFTLFSQAEESGGRREGGGGEGRGGCGGEGRGREECRSTLYYQWYHNRVLIAGATSSHYTKTYVQRSDTGTYYCEVSSGYESSVRTQEAEIALAHEKTTAVVNDFRKSQKQISHIEARRPLMTTDEKRFAPEKVALLIGNQNYKNGGFPSRNTPENDTKRLAEALENCGFKVIVLVNLEYHEMSDALQSFYSLLEPGVYAVFAYTGHGFSYQSEDYIVPVDAKAPNPNHCFSVKIICDHLQQLMCRVFVILNCCRSRVNICDKEEVKGLDYKSKYNFGNIAIICSASADQSAYEKHSQACSSFCNALTLALNNGGTFANVFFSTTKAMKDALEAMNGASYTEPVYILGSMDNEISFNDRVMLHNTEIEERLDHLLEVWKKANTPPRSCSLLPSSDLTQFIDGVDLKFSAEFSNVLLVMVEWTVCHDTCPSCEVTLEPQDQDIEIQEIEHYSNKATFRVCSLQRLKANLKLHISFLITSNNGTITQDAMIFDLQSRPLYSRDLLVSTTAS